MERNREREREVKISIFLCYVLPSMMTAFTLIHCGAFEDKLNLAFNTVILRMDGETKKRKIKAFTVLPLFLNVHTILKSVSFQSNVLT